MTDKAFSPDALADFQTAYPQQPLKLRHNLCDHPLVQLKALCELATRLPPEDVDYTVADLPMSVPNDATPSNGLSIEETIRGIEENRSYMVLKFVQNDPAYDALIHEVLGEVLPTVRPVTGPMHRIEGFIFVSSPNALTPIHFDPEHNILFHIRGNKTMTVFPQYDEEIASAEAHEQYHIGGPRNLPWRDEFAERGTPYPLTPGEAIYVPPMAPHWVQNGPEVAISFSMAWRSRWVLHEADARAFNRRLRRLGLKPASPKPYPQSNMLKSVAHRALRKAERVVGLGK